MTDVGVDDNFMKTLGAKLTARRRGADHARPQRRPGPRDRARAASTAARSSRPRSSEDDEAHLRAALGEPTAAG